jgi:autotransporter-associated beta strand protein
MQGATWNVGGTFPLGLGQAAIGSLSGAGNVDLNDSDGVPLNALHVGGDNSSTTWSGVISGTGSLVKEGTGTFTLSGSNTYNGGTFINAGTLEDGWGFPNNSRMTVASGGTLQLTDEWDGIGSLAGAGNVKLVDASLYTGYDGSSTSFSGVMSGTGTLFKEGAGTFTVTGPGGFGRPSPLIYVGHIVVDGGTLQLGVSNAITSTCAVTVNPGSILTRASLDLSGHYATIGSLSGGGSVTLGGASLYTGYDGTTTTFSGVISGSGSLYKEGGGTFTLAGQNLYTGGTSIDAGVLQLGTMNAVASASAVTVATGATFDVNGNTDQVRTLTGTGNVTLGNGDLLVGDGSSTVFSGAISGAGTLSKEGNGTLTLNGPDTYANTVIDAGTLTLSSVGVLPASEAVVVNSAGVFDLNNLDVTIASLSGTGYVKLGTGNLRINVSSSTTDTFGGVLSGYGDLYKMGAGDLVLSGTNTYSGATHVNDGRLFVNGSLSSFSVVLVSNAILGGTGTVGAVDVLTGSLLIPGFNGFGTLNTGSVWFASGTTLTLPPLGGLNVAGTINLSNGPTLDIPSFAFLPPKNGPFAILTSTAILGTFQGMPDGSKITIGGHVYVIHSTSTSVTLTRIS